MTDTAKPLNFEKLTAKVVRLFYLLSPPVSLGISWLILKFSARSFESLWRNQENIDLQILYGLGAGTVIALASGFVVVKVRGLADLRDLISQAFLNAKPTWWDLILTSVSAGFSEELLFRGSLQPLVGIYFGALLFAMAHGAGPTSRKGFLLFGAFVFVIGVLLGALCERIGLISAMVMHACLDLVALIIYRQWIFCRAIAAK